MHLLFNGVWRWNMYWDLDNLLNGVMDSLYNGIRGRNSNLDRDRNVFLDRHMYVLFDTGVTGNRRFGFSMRGQSKVGKCFVLRRS